MSGDIPREDLTTEQARILAFWWSAWAEHDTPRSARPLMPPARHVTEAEREQLLARVRARILAEGNPDAWQDPAEHMVNIVASDLGITDAQAEALIDAADGWPP